MNNKTNLIKASQVKKGMEIFQIGTWNYHNGCERRDHFSRDSRGRGVYTPRTEDQVYIQKYIVHSCGKKRMYVMDLNADMRGREFVIDQESGYFYSHFAGTLEQAKAAIQDMIAEDEFAGKYPVVIVENPFAK